MIHLVSPVRRVHDDQGRVLPGFLSSKIRTWRYGQIQPRDDNRKDLYEIVIFPDIGYEPAITPDLIKGRLNLLRK